MQRTRSTVVFGAAAAMLMFAAGGSARASLSQNLITSPGGFIQAGAYQSSCGCGMIPGQDLEVLIGTPQEFNEFAFAGDSSVTASASFSGSNINNSVTGTAGMGFLRMQTSDSFPNSAFFSLAGTNGGWKETFTVSHPGLNGQSGFMLFRIRARGTLHTTGFSGACGISTTGYKDNNELLVNALFDRSESDPVGSDRQRSNWSLSSDFSTLNRTIDASVTMAVPITFGQSFTLGVYAFATSGQRSVSGVGGISTGVLDFGGGNGVEWGGIASIQSGGGPVSDYTITSGTGIDWVPGFGEACPADFNGDTFVDPDDLSDFITCFFLDVAFPGTCANADFNGDGFRDPDDLADFITAFFLGC